MLFRVAKDLECEPELAGGIELCRRPGLVTYWNSTRKIAASYRRWQCLDIPTRAAAPATPKGQAGKGKYTKQFNVFPESDNNDDDFRVSNFTIRNIQLHTLTELLKSNIQI